MGEEQKVVRPEQAQRGAPSAPSAVPMPPVRVQRKRSAGWVMPENTVYVGRPTMWGNRWQIGTHSNHLGRAVETQQEAVDVYSVLMWPDTHHRAWVRESLGGKNLACWCALDEPCHADFLLALANSADGSEATTNGNSGTNNETI